MIQIFGIRSSQPTRAAERFFKERRVPVHFVDLYKKPMSPGEIKRFIDRFTLAALVDRENPDIKYLRLTDADLVAKIEQDPKLLHLPLVRSTKILSIGHDEASWKSMLAE
ncbi:MAG TPA: ArsC/Spx/MgsR family protein [Bryobacteraceae bacterium]|nr:ArsC/Spx/MgsR family protein [Bryobacteraceae bacterium]